MKAYGQSLSKVTERASELKQVYKKDLSFGDLVIIRTLNSTYKIRVLANGLYAVSGGWFDAQGASPTITRIAGCSWGGSVIKIDVLAACGLCLEFGNRVVTSPIKEVVVLRFTESN